MTNYIKCSQCNKLNCTSQIANYCALCGNEFKDLTSENNLIGCIDNVKLLFFNSKYEIFNCEFQINQSITIKLFKKNIMLLSQKDTNTVIQNNKFSIEIQKDNSEVLITLKSENYNFNFSYKINQNNYLKVSQYENILTSFCEGN